MSFFEALQPVHAILVVQLLLLLLSGALTVRNQHTAGMTGANFVSAFLAEWHKLMSRIFARAGLVLALLIGIGMPPFLYLLKWGGLVAGNRIWTELSPENEAIPWTPIDMDSGLIYALWMRNFFIMAAFLILLASVSFAGEFKAKTLREDMLRPVPRDMLLLAKWSALVAWAALALLLTWLPCTLESFVLFRGGGNMLLVTEGFMASWLVDVSIISAGLFLAVLTRSVPITLLGLIFLYGADYGLSVSLGLAPTHMLPDDYKYINTAKEAFLPFTYSNAVEFWQGYNTEPSRDIATLGDKLSTWSLQGLSTLLLLIHASMAGAVLWFRRMDVP